MSASAVSDTVSAIDLGTNTVLMVTGRRGGDGDLEILDDAYAVARLGEGVDAEKRIQPQAMERVCDCLQSYRERADALGATRIRACGTSALRDAANGAEFAATVEEVTGIEVVSLSGEEEARLTFAGAGFGMSLPPRYAVLDIGGGSTEFAIGDGHSALSSKSVDVGAVRVTERFFTQLPPHPDQVAAAADAARRTLAEIPPPPPPGVDVLGVGGTIATLGAVAANLAPGIDAHELDGRILTAADVSAICARLLSSSLEQIRAIPEIEAPRADIITGGALVLRSFLDLLNLPGITVSTRGIRYGILQRMLAD